MLFSWPIGFQVVYVWLMTYIVKIRMNSLSVLFWDEVHLSIFRGSCLNLELLRILLIIWIAVWQYFIIILFSESKFLSSSMKAVVGTCACALSLDHLGFRLLYLSTYSLSVLFWDECSSSYFSRKLCKFGAYVNSLDHLDCSCGTLAVFYNLFKEAKFSPINEGSCWNLGLFYFSWPFAFQIVHVWLIQSKSG